MAAKGESGRPGGEDCRRGHFRTRRADQPGAAVSQRAAVIRRAAISRGAKSRESQARFVCTAYGFACHADVNAAINIAAGHAVTARGGDGAARPVNREPHLLLPSAQQLESPAFIHAGEDVNMI